MTEDEMVGWHHQLNGHVFEQTLGDGGGPGTLVCCIHMGLQRVRHDRATEQQQHSCLGNPMEREAKQTMVHGIAKSQTQLINEQFIGYFQGLSSLECKKHSVTHILCAWVLSHSVMSDCLQSHGL